MNNISYQQFLKIKNDFSLGTLTTEGFHKETQELSKLSKEDISQALAALKKVDELALDKFQFYYPGVLELKNKIKETFDQGRKVFVCGCGATGRLALSCEFLFREKYNSDSVISFMAGGDYALIKSVESFEDRMSYGARQLVELGFQDGDLLLAVTEGGETSFVIGAAREASVLSKNDPFFIYCNPDNELNSIVRSNEILVNDKIKKLNLSVGEMAISGSTRMQATTIQMIACASSLLYFDLSDNEFLSYLDSLTNELKSLDYNSMKTFIEKETNIYKEGGIVSYSVDSELAICVLTDTTERSPTFSLKPFEQIGDHDISLCYLTVKEAYSSEIAWEKVLGRKPRCLNWSNIDFNLTDIELYKFDVSEKSIFRREELNRRHFVFDISNSADSVDFRLGESLSIKCSSDLLTRHLICKVLLNSLSTLIMCRLDRVEGNMMTWVKPSNLKLIDRAARYIERLAPSGKSYNEALEVLFKQLDSHIHEESIVLNCVKELRKN